MHTKKKTRFFLRLTSPQQAPTHASKLARNIASFIFLHGRKIIMSYMHVLIPAPHYAGYMHMAESSTLLVSTSIVMSVTVVMALVSLTALTASVIICCKRPRSKDAAGETHSVYYSTVSERTATTDPTYDEISSTVRAKDITVEPNQAYHPVSVLQQNEAYHHVSVPEPITD